MSSHHLLLVKIVMSILILDHHHCTNPNHFNLSTSYIPQMGCESYVHYDNLSVRAFGPSGPNEQQWFALLTFNGSSSIEPLLALDCELQCILLPSSFSNIPTKKIVPAEVNRRLTRCTLFLQPENFMILNPTAPWLQTMDVTMGNDTNEPQQHRNLFGLQTTQTQITSSEYLHHFYIGLNRQINENVSEHIISSVMDRPNSQMLLFNIHNFVSKSTLPEVLLSSDQPSVIFGLRPQTTSKPKSTFCIVKIEYGRGQLDDVVVPHTEKKKKIRLTITELSKCISVNLSISSGYYSEKKGLLLLAIDSRQEVLFFYPLNDIPKVQIAKEVSRMKYKDFFVCGTKKSTYAINIGVFLSIAVFLLILLLVSTEKIPIWKTTRELKQEQENKLASSSGDHDLKTTTTIAKSSDAKTEVEKSEKSEDNTTC